MRGGGRRRRWLELLLVVLVVALSGAPGAVGASAATPNWITYHNDNARHGVDSTSPPMGAVHQVWTSATLDGAVYGNPLVLDGRTYVATENNSVYALDAATGQVIWRRHLGTPVDGSTLPCGNINPSGITGTPAMGPGHKLLYAVAFLAGQHHVLYGIDVATGAVSFSRPAGPLNQSPSTIQQRGALTVAHGHVYIPCGGLAGDCGQYRGAVVGMPPDGVGPRLQYTVGVQREGAIWAPSGISQGGIYGDLYAATGNGSSSGFDYGDSVIRLSGDLRVQSYFRPSNGGQLNNEDLDLGSVAPAPVSRNRLFAVGKSGVGYLLGAVRLGGVGGYQRSHLVCSGGAYGGTAYAPPYLFVPCRDGLYAVDIEQTDFRTVWRSPSYYAGAPVVAGGAVWTVDRDDATLRAYSLHTGGQVYQAPLGTTVSFVAPTAAAGRILVPAGNRILAFGV